MNENMKEGFCKDYLRSRIIQKTSLYGLFRKIELYEENLGKDVSEFTRDEALAMYTWLKSRSVYTLMNNNTILKAYCAWLKYHHGLDSDIYEHITIDDLKPCVDKNASKLLSREEITEIEDRLLNWSDKAIVELLFIGVAGKNMEDIYAVSNECINGDNLIINGKEFPMTERLKELLPKAFAETEIMSYGKTMKIVSVNGKNKIYKERYNAMGIETEDSIFRYFYRRIQLFRNYLDIPELTMKGISASGLLFYVHAGMNDSGLDLRSFLKTKDGEKIAKRYGFGDYWVENITAKYKEYLR